MVKDPPLTKISLYHSWSNPVISGIKKLEGNNLKDSIMFTIDSWYILIPVFFIYLLTLFLVPKFKQKKYSILQYLLLITFGIYLLSVIHLVFFPIDVNIGIYANLTPWYKTINFIPVLTIDVTTFLLNVIMLIPFGIYVPLLNSNVDSVKKIAKQGFFLSLSLEIVQLIIRTTLGSGRSTDINDLIANTLGAIIGYLIIMKLLQMSSWKVMLSKFKLSEK